MDRYVMLEDRGFVVVGGDKRLEFLQSVVSDDVTWVSESRVALAALSTAEGRHLQAVYVVDQGDRLLLDCEQVSAGELHQRLSLSSLHWKVALADVSNDYRVAACFGPTILDKLELSAPGQAREYAGGIAYVDPRLAALGARILLHAGLGEDPLVALGCVRAGPEDYHAHSMAACRRTAMPSRTGQRA